MKNYKNLFLLLALSSLILTGCNNPPTPSSSSETSSVTSSSEEPSSDIPSSSEEPSSEDPSSEIPSSSEEPSSEDPSSEIPSSSEEPSSEEPEPSSSEPSSEEPILTNFEKALVNTKYYSLQSSSSAKYYEIVQDDLYYSSPSFSGYVAPKSDIEFFHSFSVKNIKEGNQYFDIMDVYGRACRREDILRYTNFRMYDILYYYQDSFIQSSENQSLYYSYDKNLSPIFEEFFQQKLIGSCNYFELEIKNDRFSKIKFYEYYQSANTLLLNLSCDFTTNDGTDTTFYQRWVEDNEPYNIRIRDIKNLVPSKTNSSIPMSLYEYETITIDAIVSAIDLNKSIYVTQNDERAGPIGLEIKVDEEITDLCIGEEITITGTIKTETKTDINTYMYNVEYTKSGTSSSFAPSYDEDYMVDTYGGGTYAGVMFSRNLMYSGSLYCTYAYVLELPNFENNNEDLVVTLVCPDIVDLGGKKFVMELKIPASLDATLKEEMKEILLDAGIYDLNVTASSAKQLSLSNFLIDYNFSYILSHYDLRGDYPVTLVATNDSSISYKLSLVEKIENYFGLAAFPVLNNDHASYKFGGASGLFIESVYGDYETKNKTGLFISYTGVTTSIFATHQASLINYGFTKFDEIKDISRERHYIFTLDNVVLDYSLSLNDNTLLCWIYNKPIIMQNSIEEQLKNAIGSWFDVDKYFARLSGTYDADYTLYNLKSYAGNDYSNNPLTVLGIDLNTNRYNDYLRELVSNLGYKQYRNPETNRPATYKMRGVNHQGIYLSDANIYVDIAVYETKDYTYAGHNNWQYRIELVFIQGNAPMAINTYNNLDILTNIIKDTNPIAYFNPTLPDDAVVEYWFEESGSILDRDVTYGFGSRNEAYVYSSDVAGTYTAITDALEDAGYQLWGSTTNVYVIYDGDDSYLVTLLKEEDRGFVRVIQGTGGVDFWRN